MLIFKVTEGKRISMVKNLPNIFTSLRIACTPLILIFLTLFALHMGDGTKYAKLAFWIYVIAAATDWVDGFLARALDAKSELGAKLDLLADKLLVGISILAIIVMGLISVPSFSNIIIASGVYLILSTSVRDYIVTKIRKDGESFGLSMPATFLAKSKTAVIMVGLGMFLGSIAFKIGVLIFPALFVIIIGSLMSLYTGFQYLSAYKKAKKLAN